MTDKAKGMFRNEHGSGVLDRGALLKACAVWATPDELMDLAVLIANESNWVVGSCETPRELVDSYGIREDDDAKSTYGTNDEMTPVDAIEHILRTHWSWGEFLGGVLASFASWPDDAKGRIRPTLTATIKRCASSGVDH